MRLVTRGDLDGLTSAVIVTTCETIDDILLIHPQDVTDRRFVASPGDIFVNLPYQQGCAKWFDHHLLTNTNETPPPGFDGRWGLAPSAARMVYEYYLPKNPGIRAYAALLDETDRMDAAQLTLDDVLAPKGYILLGFTLDPRTGLGAFKEYFHALLQALKTQPLDRVLALPEVQERVLRMREQDALFRRVTIERSRLDGNVVVTDFRGIDPVPVGNRFLVYTLFPEANISVRVHRGPTPDRVAVTIGHSIFNRTSRTNVGYLAARHGGGGHKAAGTCLVPLDQADAALAEMIAVMKKDG
ncbi:MAG: exopolyphosphatase [Vicinamibacteria bacterium]|nr:exopolyphosphatase [Vicinamibacteria bacterium]